VSHFLVRQTSLASTSVPWKARDDKDESQSARGVGVVAGAGLDKKEREAWQLGKPCANPCELSGIVGRQRDASARLPACLSLDSALLLVLAEAGIVQNFQRRQ
jgi:hypothetical protein